MNKTSKFPQRIAMIILTVLMFIALAASAIASDGDVVPSFAPQLVRDGEVLQIVVQPDGKILLVGRFTAINGALLPSLARLNADGSRDSSFTPLVENNNVVVAAMPLNFVDVAPGIFTADASGKGYPAAQVLRVRADGSQSYEPVATLNAAGQWVGRPIDLGAEAEQLFLVLFGTGSNRGQGVRGAEALIGNTVSQIQFLGRAPGFVGLDQINIRIPRSLKGVNADVEVKITVDGIAANTVKINVK